MARTAHNRRLHRKKDRETLGGEELIFVPVADEMIQRLREQGDPDPDPDPLGGLKSRPAAGAIRPRRRRPS